MIDLILASAIAGAAYGGFKLGAKYSTFRAMLEAMTQKKQ